MSYQNAKLMNLEDGQKLLEAIDQHKAEKDGAYEDLTAGNALYLLSDRGDTDVAPYVFRKTGGAKNGYGREFLRKIVGGTVAWNQLAGSSLKRSVSVFTWQANNTIKVDGTVSVTDRIWLDKIVPISGHKYLYICNSKTITGYIVLQSTVVEGRNVIFQASGTNQMEYGLKLESGVTYNETASFIVADLTQMFGSTIADAIYAMEQATAGSGVAWFRNLFPNDYYAYDAGSLQSVQAKEHGLTGFNQWDEQWEVTTYQGMNSVWTKNHVPVMPNTEYCINMGHSVYTIKICQFDANKNLISAEDKSLTNHIRLITTSGNCHYLKIGFNANYGSVYANDVCINLSDSSRNGQYEPYAGHTYPLDSSLTLRGIPKWDSTNGLYYDGDEYEADGTVTRRYGVVDLGTINWTKFTVDDTLTMFRAQMSDIKLSTSGHVIANVICSKYPTVIALSRADKTCYVQANVAEFDIVDNDYSDPADFKTAMSGVYLVYELATPTTETADAFRELQISAHGGTEEFVDAGVTAITPTRDVSVPVGTETFYPVDIWHLIDELTALVLEN